MSENEANEAVVEYSGNQGGGIIALMPIMSLEVAKSRLKEFQRFIKECMVPGEDYGTIPGTKKPTLYKPGADKLAELYGLKDRYKILDKIVDFNAGLFDYEIECELVKDGLVISTGLGSCSSWESKYRWRESKRVCPGCGKETIFKSKQGPGGWFCWAKKGGCGAQFSAGDPAIENQKIGRVENEDIVDTKNTVLKMAKKRAKIDATLSATRSSGIFTQDVSKDDEDEEFLNGKGETPPPATGQSHPMPKRKSEKDVPAPNGQKPTGDVILESEAKAFYAICGHNNLGPKEIDDVLGRHGYQSAFDVKRKDYDAICALAKTYKPKSAEKAS